MFRIPLTRPWLPDDIAEDLQRVVASGFLTEGEETEAFEAEIAAFLGVAHVIAVTSATTGLELALWALGVGPGDEVLVPDFTYPATASAVARVGASIALVDVDPATMNTTAAILEKAAGTTTRALLPVSIFGNPLDSDSIGALARSMKVPWIDDAACSLGAAFGGRHVGGLADATVFSLHPRKFITSGEGGLVCTNDADLAHGLRCLKRFGMEDGRFVRMGTNAKLSNLQAALARAQLRHVKELVATRQRQVAFYLDALAGRSGIRPPEITTGGEHGWQSFVVQVADRDAIRDRIRGQGIEVQIGTFALHREPAFQEGRGLRYAGGFPGSDHAAETSLALPLFHDLTEGEQAEVVDALCREVAE